jgi:xeroderma pigmentosum group C-complementing protein
MPRNIQDFKNHPIYALERHLRRNEVIHPKTEIGKVAAGKAPSTSSSITTSLEPVYRRNDVKTVRSAQTWYRLGREVLVGARPLKRVPAPRRREAEQEDVDADIALYAEEQTEVYVAPPCVDGRVAKNSYGNIDVFVPSMVPPGGVHVRDGDAVRAARILAVDYAPAVVGFDFKGGKGTAVLGGVVVASEYAEAVRAVVEGFREEKEREEREEVVKKALMGWRLFLRALRIYRRIDEGGVEGEEVEE